MNSITVTNETNTTKTAINEIRIDFPSNGLVLRNHEVALNRLDLYHSWYNISTNFNNKQFAYIYNGTSYNVTMPDGFYDYTDIDYFMKQTMSDNGHYMLDQNGEAVYFVHLDKNTTYYGVTLSLDVITTPAGGSNPNSMVTGTTMQLVISNNGFQDIIGVNAGTYPIGPSLTKYAFNSSKVPILSPVTTIHCTLSCVSNPFNRFTDQVYTFSPNKSYSSFLSYEPFQPVFYKAIDGSYTNLRLQFFDQSYRPLELIDKTSITAVLLFRSTV